MQGTTMPIADCFATIRVKAGVMGVSGVTSYTATPRATARVLPAASMKMLQSQTTATAVTPETPVTPNYDDIDWRDMFEERAAIMEYDGGFPRAEAEQQAQMLIDEMRRAKLLQ